MLKICLKLVEICLSMNRKDNSEFDGLYEYVFGTSVKKKSVTVVKLTKDTHLQLYKFKRHER